MLCFIVFSAKPNLNRFYSMKPWLKSQHFLLKSVKFHAELSSFPLQEFVFTATMAFFYFTAFTAQFADLGGFTTDEYAHRYAAQIVAGVS